MQVYQPQSHATMKRSREDSASSEDKISASSPQSTSQDAPSGDISVHPPKYALVDASSADMESRIMRCLLPPHKPLSFTSYEDYETHYNSAHIHRCSECHRNFPDAHFLDLHISENHDPIVAAKRAKGEKTYTCFVKDCEKVCSDWRKRRSHLVDKHGFPKNYDFLVVDSGLDGKWNMLRLGVDAQGHRKSSRERRSSIATRAIATTQEADAIEVDQQDDAQSGHGSVASRSRKLSTSVSNAPQKPMQKAAVSVDDITSSMSALNMVPRSVTFGKRKGRAGFAKS